MPLLLLVFISVAAAGGGDLSVFFENRLLSGFFAFGFSRDVFILLISAHGFLRLFHIHFLAARYVEPYGALISYGEIIFIF